MNNLPEKLCKVIQVVKGMQYRELYEDTNNNTITLYHTVGAYTAVLDRLSYTQIHCMCGILSKAVLPTLQNTIIDLYDFEKVTSYGDQAVDKALLVLTEYKKVKTDTGSMVSVKASAIEMLKLVIEGYAVLPSVEARRQLFDWWLTDVIPAAYNLSEPDKYLR